MPETHYSDSKTYTGYVRRQGDLKLGAGVNLNQAVLYVDGDLEIDGPLTGVGGVFVTGKVTLRGGADLSSSNMCAVVANGDVRVLGDGSDRSYFNGLIYTKGQGGFADQDASLDLLLKDVTVQGTVISAGTATAGSKMEVDRSTVAYSEAGTKIGFDVSFSSAIPPAGLSGGIVKWKLIDVNSKSVVPTAAYFAQLGRSPQASDFEFLDANGNLISDPAQTAGLFNNLSSWLTATIIPQIEAAKSQSSSTAAFSIELNQFLQGASQNRVVYRRV